MKQYISFIIAALVLVLSLAVPASAETVEEDSALIENSGDVVFGVTWDVQRPSTLVFIDPYGNEYDTAKQSASTTTITSENGLYYVVLNASAGQWRIRYDKGSNTVLEVSVFDYNSGMSVESFTLGAVTGDYLPVTFRVNADTQLSYNWRISAVVDHSGDEKELLTGWGYTSEDIIRDVPLQSLATYSQYMLKLYVWYNDNGVDIFDVAFSDKFSYVNSGIDNYNFTYTLTVYPETQAVKVNWDGLNWNAESVMVALFEDNSAEPVVYDEYNPDNTKSVELGYNPSASTVSIEVSVKFNGLFTTPLRKTLKVSDFGIKIPEGNAFNTVFLPLDYASMSQQLVSMDVNGYVTEHILNGNGSLKITLGDDWNKINVSFTDAESVLWVIEREIFIDRVAPVLNPSRVYDGMSVAGETVVVSGTVTDCAKLTVNGNAVEISSDNSFSTQVKLNEGANVVSVVAVDALGNETQYTATVTRKGVTENGEVTVPDDNASSDEIGKLFDTVTADGSYWILGGVSVLCLLVIVYALIFWRKKGGK